MNFSKICFSIVLLATTATAEQPLFTCAEDNQISDGNREGAINSAAIKYFNALLGNNAAAAFDAMSKEGRQTTTLEQLETGARVARESKLKNVSLQHTYYIEANAAAKRADRSYTIPITGGPTDRVICAKDITKPDGWVSLKVTNVPEQAHVLLSVDAPNNKWAIAIWLLPEEARWKVQGFSLRIATLGDEGSQELWEDAREQNFRGHKLNAALLYATAEQLVDRGPTYQLGIQQWITEDRPSFVKPAEIQGDPPYFWKSDRTTWKVLNVGLIGIGTNIYVVVSHEVSPWKTDDQVDEWNKALIAYFKTRFPEYSNIFAGVVASAYEQGTTRGYRTVDELP